MVVERRPTTNRYDKPAYLPEALDRSVVLSGVADRFWHDRRAVTLDKTDGPHGRSIGFWNADLDGHTYYGELDELIDELAAFRADGTRRNVLLQGKPGCGKSTLCRHAARELSDRTVMLTADFLSAVHGREWSFLLDVLRPEMLIVDDIDRMNGRLDDKLGVFEEGYCDVPIALFTSNDHTKLPVALRRPGRIDRIFEVDEPGEEVRRRIIRELAAEEGVDIPDVQFDRLLAILEDFSAAHVVEALRHARVCGWQDDPLPGDVTFDERGQEEADPQKPGWQPAVYG
jgi:energy-coupling factor transporter ATP-binding protein EcfA2